MRMIENRQVDDEPVGTFGHFEEPQTSATFSLLSPQVPGPGPRLSLCGLT